MKEGLEMYFNKDLAKVFGEREQNEKSFRVSKIVDRLLMHHLAKLPDPLHVADLGAGAHPDRYDGLFSRLIAGKGVIDWVDISPEMLALARTYAPPERAPLIHYVHQDIISYLEGSDDDFFGALVMKYTFDHLSDLHEFFRLVARKLKPGGVLVGTLTTRSSELRSISTNARFLYQGKEFPEHETRTLQEGEGFQVQFFKESGNPSAGYIDGAIVTKYFHSQEAIETAAAHYGLACQVGDWHAMVPIEQQEGEELQQDIVLLHRTK